jgi:hypothetical protein
MPASLHGGKWALRTHASAAGRLFSGAADDPSEPAFRRPGQQKPRPAHRGGTTRRLLFLLDAGRDRRVTKFSEEGRDGLVPVALD